MRPWEEFLQKQEEELGQKTVDKWLRVLKVVDFDAGNLYLEAKDSFQVLWFEEHIRPKIVASLVNNNHKKIRVHLSVANGTQKKASPTPLKPKKAAPPTFELKFDPIDPLFLFETFVEDKENEVPFRLLKEGGVSFNPIYLYGVKGSGKTHLLMAYVRDQMARGKKILYTHAETFTDHVVSAIRSGEMGKFRLAYRNVDALVIDDAHLFSRKGATQEELFHTFNTLHQEGRQIILAANCAPGKLQEIEPRLVSRFEWGIVLPLQEAKDAALKQVLFKKAETLGYPLPLKVADFLIEEFTSSPKALIQALESLILRSHIDSKKGKKHEAPVMTVPLAKHFLLDLLLSEKQNEITDKKIIQASALYYGIRPEDILGKAQNRECSHPRQLAMYLCRRDLKLSFTELGTIFGRDHSTVMTSVRSVQKALDGKDEEFTQAISEIEKALKSRS